MVGAAVATHLSRLPATRTGGRESHPAQHSVRAAIGAGARLAGSAGWLIPWPCAALARRRCERCSPCRPTRHRCGCSPTRRPRCWPAYCTCSTGWRCSSMLRPTAIARHRGFRLRRTRLAAGCSSMRHAHSSRSVRSSFSGSPPPGRTAPRRSCSSAIVVLLLSPRGDLAYGGAIAFALGTAGVGSCARRS